MNDGDLTLLDYWTKYSRALEKQRGWQTTVKAGQTTYEAYNRIMRKLVSTNLDTIGKKAMSRLSLLDFQTAVDNLRQDDGAHYSPASKEITFSVLHVIYRFASNAGHALDPFACSRVRKPRVYTSPQLSEVRKIIERVSNGKSTVNESVAKLRSAIAKTTFRRSLSIDEIQRLLKLIWNGITLDGRYVGLDLAFYLGTRPGETRALRWEDITVLKSKSNRRCYLIRNSLSRTTAANGKTKTDNGFRKIPEHCELYAIIDARYRFILDQTGQEPTGYICCPGNDFGKPCSYYMFADFAEKNVMRFLNDEFLVVMSAEFILEQLGNDPSHDSEDNLTLYCLRHTFYTWLASSTDLSELERAYLMGHEMKENDRDIRSRFNDDDLLAHIGDDMDRFVCLPAYHPKCIVLDPDSEKPIHCSGVGMQKFTTHLNEGDCVVLDFVVHSDHPGTETVFQNLSAVKGSFDVMFELSEIVPMGEPDRRPRSVSNEYALWQYLKDKH